jgi:hypothetical protein
MVTPPAVTLDSLVIDAAPDGTGTDDGTGVIWTLTLLQGWWDSADVRAALQEVQPFGEIITAARENSRAIVLEAVATLADAGNRDPLGDLYWTAVETAKTAGRCVIVPVTMSVVDPSNTLTASVRRVQPIRTSMIGEVFALRVQWPLTAQDPSRYDGSAVAHD